MVAPCLEPYPPHSTSLLAKVKAGAVALGSEGNRLSQDHALSLARTTSSLDKISRSTIKHNTPCCISLQVWVEIFWIQSKLLEENQATYCDKNMKTISKKIKIPIDNEQINNLIKILFLYHSLISNMHCI